MKGGQSDPNRREQPAGIVTALRIEKSGKDRGRME